jgi:predicted dinucleotide-binding enzyme
MNQSRREFLIVAAALIAAGALPWQALAADKKMKIGIVGSGNVGSAIGASWVRAGHEVMFSSLNLEHDKALAAKLGGGARAGTPREAAAFGEVLMISVPYDALPAVGKDLGELLKGKIVIDTNNPFTGRDGDTGKWALEKGAGFASKELLPGARIVRAFNAIAAAQMGAAYQSPGKVGMPIASDDAQAIEVASRLIHDVGYEPVLIGGLEKGKYLMPGTALAGEHSAEEIKKIAAGLN